MIDRELDSQISAADEEQFAADDFQEYLNDILHDWLRTLTALACMLMPAFFILDYFTMPKELLTRFGAYRLASTAIVALQWFIIRYTKPSPRSYWHGYLASINMGGVITLMTVDLGGFSSSYYAGLNLVIMGVNLLLPWRAIHSAVNSVIVIGMYIALNSVASANYVMAQLTSNLFFMVATAIIAVSINHLRYNLVRKEFDLMVALKNARDAIWSEMELAKRIQTALLPNREHIHGLEIAATMVPATEVGGDYYDIIETKAGDRWVVIGDVSGHGVDSGLIMMMAQTSVMSIVSNSSNLDPSQVLSGVNTALRENISRLGSDYYMTMTAIRFDGRQMVVAGQHQDIIIYRSRLNRTEVIPTQGTWLGISDDISAALRDEVVTLEDNDLVLLFTDGVTEATDERGEMYGQARLELALNQFADLPVTKLLNRIIEQVTDFQAEQNDDLTVLVIRKAWI